MMNFTKSSIISGTKNNTHVYIIGNAKFNQAFLFSFVIKYILSLSYVIELLIYTFAKLEQRHFSILLKSSTRNNFSSTLKKEYSMLFILRLIFAGITATFSLWVLITDNNQLMPWAFIAMAMLFLTIAFDDYIKGYKKISILFLAAFVYIIFTSIYIF